MKLLRFLSLKIVIIEVMLIILNMALIYFGVIFPIFSTLLVFLTPISVVAFVLYIIFSLLDSHFVQTVLAVVLGGIILYYLFKYVLV